MFDNMSWGSSVNSAESLIINEGGKSIGDKAFWGFSNLTYINKTTENDNVINKFPEGLETIGASAFIKDSQNACPITGEIEFPSTLKSIGNYAFCSAYSYTAHNNITSIKFGEGTEDLLIGIGAFQYSTSLESIEFPKRIKSIDGNAFYGCENLTANNNALFSFDMNLESIGSYAFDCCPKLSGCTLII